MLTDAKSCNRSTCSSLQIIKEETDQHATVWKCKKGQQDAAVHRCKKSMKCYSHDQQMLKDEMLQPWMIKDEKDEKPATDQQMIQSTMRKDQWINTLTDQRSKRINNEYKCADKLNEEKNLSCILRRSSCLEDVLKNAQLKKNIICQYICKTAWF